MTHHRFSEPTRRVIAPSGIAAAAIALSVAAAGGLYVGGLGSAGSWFVVTLAILAVVGICVGARYRALGVDQSSSSGGVVAGLHPGRDFLGHLGAHLLRDRLGLGDESGRDEVAPHDDRARRQVLPAAVPGMVSRPDSRARDSRSTFFSSGISGRTVVPSGRRGSTSFFQ